MAADGAVVAVLKLDDKPAQQELNRLTQKISRLQEKIDVTGAKRMPIFEQVNALGLRLDEEKAKLAEMESSSLYTPRQIDRQREAVASDQADFDAASKQLEKYDTQLRNAQIEMDVLKNKAGELASQLATGMQNAEAPVEDVGGAAQQAGESMEVATEQAGEMAQQISYGMQNAEGAVEGAAGAVQNTGYSAQEAAGQLEDVGSAGSDAGNAVSGAMAAATARLEKLMRRIGGLARSVFVFSIITMALRGVRSWVSRLLKTNEEATAAMNRLKGSLLTLAQPLVGVIIPAVTTLLNVLADVVSVLAEIVAKISGMTARDSAEAAKALYEEQNALDGVGKSAKKSAGALAGFDEINKLSTGTSEDAESTGPDFGLENEGSMLDGLEEKVAAGLLIGGVALVVLGAALTNLKLLIAGLALLGVAIAYSEESGVAQDWAEALGFERAEELITAALLVAGMAAVVIGIATGNIMLFFAGAALIGAGIVYGESNDVFSSWAEALGLDTVFDYVVAAMQLAGIALIAIGAAMANIGMVIAGAALLVTGAVAESIGEETLKSWWETLQLTTIQQWVGVVMLLVGIALVAIGAALGRIGMILIGAALIGLSAFPNAEGGNLKNWAETLGLDKVMGWVTAALLLVGIALVIIGLIHGNIPMVLAGAGLLGAGVVVGITSGTFKTWLEEIGNALQAAGQWFIGIWDDVWEFLKGFLNFLLTVFFGTLFAPINALAQAWNLIADLLNSVSIDIPDWVPVFGGYTWGFDLPKLPLLEIPQLAQGAVIPPNREFLAVLGDQKQGTNIEAPLDTIMQAFRQVMREGAGARTIVLQLDEREFGRVVLDTYNAENRRVGVQLGGAT